MLLYEIPVRVPNANREIGWLACTDRHRFHLCRLRDNDGHPKLFRELRTLIDGAICEVGTMNDRYLTSLAT